MTKVNNNMRKVQKRHQPFMALCVFMIAFFASVLLSLFITESLFADSNGKVLIINSDMSVGKYAYVQTEFKAGIDVVVDHIDLGSKWINEAKIKKKILKTAPDVIYCIGSKAYLFASKLAKDKKIVFSLVINWRRFSMGKNTYGIANELSQGMELTTLRYFFPDINKIGVLYSKAYNKEWLDIAIDKAKDLGIEIVGESVKKPKDIKKSLEKLLSGVDAVMLIPDPIVVNDVKSVYTIFEQCETMKKPVFAYSKAFINFKPVLVVAPDAITMGRQAGRLVNDLLQNHKIKERIQSPAGSHVILNLKKVEEYGLNLNSNALDSVNEIIR